MQEYNTIRHNSMFDLTTFKNPPSAYRIHPFWFWNGEMDDHEIARQIREMADKGVGGFFICPRQGLKVPYLSEDWFKKVKFAVETAKTLNMDVWLYDEYPYPSGIAGGEVTLLHPDAKHYTLVHKSETLQINQTCNMELPWGRVLSAKAVPVDQETGSKRWDEAIDIKKYIGNYQSEPVYQKVGLTTYNQKRFFTYNTIKILKWTAPEGDWEIHCFLEEEIDDFKYYGTFVDPCNREAIKTFIELTHERYAENLGGEFGKSVKGIFTDETGLIGRIPWSPQLPDFFQKHNGYDLREYLYTLIESGGENTAKVRYDYFQSIHLLLRESYHKQIYDWCEEHGIQYVAEVPSVRMSNQVYSHIPGGDSAHEKLGRSLEWILDRYMTSFRANPKMVSSLANQLGRERALIESFHSVGWSMTLQDAKWMLDRLAAFGINFYNFHAFFFTLDGLTKHDAPPSQFYQNPYWQHFRTLGDYTGRLGYVMSSGIPIRSVALLDPTTSLWTQMGNPFHNFHYIGNDDSEMAKLQRLKQDWSELSKQLLFHHKQYDHLDPEILCEAEITEGKIKIGTASYSVLVLPPLSNIESTAWTKIKLFLDQGGVVIGNKLLPFEAIDDTLLEKEILETFGMGESPCSDYWNNQSVLVDSYHKGGQNAYFIPSGQIEILLQLLNKHIHEEIHFETESGKKSFLTEKRQVSDQSNLVFISNQEEGDHHATLTVSYPCEFCRLDLETGEVELLAATWNGNGWKLDIHFGSYESCLVQINRKDDIKEVKGKSERWKWKVESKGNWEVMALQDNTLRFDHFQLNIDTEKKIQVNNQSIVPVKTFIDQCSDIINEQSLPIDFRQSFGIPMKLSFNYPISCSYQRRFMIEQMPEKCLILMDMGAISGQYQIYINEHRVENFHENFVYDNSNLTSDILPTLKHGENILRIEVLVEHDWDGVTDAIYLLGDFGVTFNKELQPVISNALNTSSLQQGPYPSYPYYAGTLAFTRIIHLDSVPEEAYFELFFNDLDRNFHDCMDVFVNGHRLGVKAWTPYQWKGKSEILHTGENVVEVKVTNTLIGLLEGKYFDYEEHKLCEVAGLTKY
ncbi:glycosyl hydrolase [Neobacillus sp. 179-C4.2 HS]|uniref:Glycosyl hydrolase n=1 Tax=Neobacillus driksii TaxID=3035913 RepID=A0ABV4YV78_9BACI|nr:glycosyl hydrolase [Neobacillus sp. 179.-C4.2 HS]MDP5192605.1 glycosyl hydrolase [Neobacillus sp. 179.-C4.2 HS]